MEDDLRIVVGFMNTLDVEGGADVLADADAAHRWLTSRGLVGEDDEVTGRDLDLARSLRAALRALAAANHDQTIDGEAAERFDRVARALPLHAEAPPTGGVRLRPGGSGAPAALGRIVATVAEASTLGTWERTKLCAADTCRWAFVDSSKNRSRRWCAMGICGNRQKTRSYRERRRDHPAQA